MLQKIQNRLVVELILSLINLLIEVRETPLLHMRTDNVNLLAIITPETIFSLSLVKKIIMQGSISSGKTWLLSKKNLYIFLYSVFGNKIKSVEACFTALKLQIEILFSVQS